MSNDRLTEIEERLAAATPGPWERDQFGPDDDSARFIGSPSTGRIVVFEAATAGNADLIAHAPTDPAALVAVVREVEKIHRPTTNAYHPDDPPCCFEDAEIWPCPTASALQKLGGTA